MQKTILITGASTGLGEAMATYLAARGHMVYGVSRSLTAAAGKPFRTLPMDVGDAQSVQQAVTAILQEQGRIDVLVNNAGLGLASPVEHLAIADVIKLLDTNVLGVLRTCQAVLPAMRRQRSGLIVNISSIAAANGLPYRGAYSASKAALDRITESLRTELAPYGIQACYIQPGAVATDMNRHRLVSPLPDDTVYKDSFERCYEVICHSIGHGLSPARFGPLLEKVILTPRVKRCYRVGRPLEKLSVILKGLLPDGVFDGLMRKFYKVG